MSHPQGQHAPRLDSTETDEAKSAAINGLEGEFSALFSQVRRLHLAAAERLAPGLSPGAYKTFSLIARRGPMTASAVVSETFADKSQVSRAIRELEERSLITRTPDPNDGRSSVLSVTEEGAARLQEARQHGGRLADTLATWETEDIVTLTRLLHALSVGTCPRDAPSEGEGDSALPAEGSGAS